MKKNEKNVIEEQALFEQYAKTKDIEIRNEIVSNNLQLVKYVAAKYLVSGVEFDDLVIAGSEGLMEAVEKYDYTLGFKFSTYAYNWIKHYIVLAIAQSGYSFRLPAKAHDDLVKLKKIVREFEEEYGFTPSAEELAEISGMDEETVSLYLSASSKTASLNQKVGEDTELGDLISDDTCSLEEIFENADRDMIVDKAVNTLLNDKEKYVVKHLFGLGGSDEMKLCEIAKELGMSSQGAHKYKMKAFRKLQDGLEKWGYGRGYAA